MAKKFIDGTNVPMSALRGMDENKKEAILKRIEDDLAAGDNAGANDALFSLAYHSGSKAGTGQGNPNVGKVQSGMWQLDEGPTWAELAVKSDSGKSDIYVQRNEDGSVKENKQGKAIVVKGEDYGKPMTQDDISRSTPGQTFLYGTNIPTAGLSAPERNRLNTQLKNAIASGDKKEASNVIFHAVHMLSKSAGIDEDVSPADYKQFMSRVYDGQYRYNAPIDGSTTYAQMVLTDADKGTSDRYVQRDLDGNPTVELVGKDYSGPTSSNIPTKIVTKSGLVDYKTQTLPTTNVGGGLLDWSDIMPQDQGLLSQAAISGGKGRYYQPHVARSGGLPASLLQYAVPRNISQTPSFVKPWGSTGPNVTLRQGDISTTRDTGDTEDTSDDTRGAADNQYTWMENGERKSGTFQQWSQAQHEAMYPGSQKMATDAGFWGPLATNLNPAYRDYKNQNIQNMINMGILPSGSTGYKSQDWIDYMGDLEAADNVEAMSSGGGHPTKEMM
jgi:hypothetical protein